MKRFRNFIISVLNISNKKCDSHNFFFLNSCEYMVESQYLGMVLHAKIPDQNFNKTANKTNRCLYTHERNEKSYRLRDSFTQTLDSIFIFNDFKVTTELGVQVSQNDLKKNTEVGVQVSENDFPKHKINLPPENCLKSNKKPVQRTISEPDSGVAAQTENSNGIEITLDNTPNENHMTTCNVASIAPVGNEGMIAKKINSETELTPEAKKFRQDFYQLLTIRKRFQKSIVIKMHNAICETIGLRRVNREEVRNISRYFINFSSDANKILNCIRKKLETEDFLNSIFPNMGNKVLFTPKEIKNSLIFDNIITHQKSH